MKKLKFIVLGLVLVLLMAACGGSGGNEPTTTNEQVNPPAQQEETTTEETTSTEETTTEETTTEETEATQEEGATAEEESGLQMSGIDPETGLEINPENVNPGDTFIIRGTIISMNLTPTTSPEFLIEAPSGQRYRIRSQPLDEIFFEDGSQIKPHEYRQGMKAMATATLAADATITDLPVTNDLTLLLDE